MRRSCCAVESTPRPDAATLMRRECLPEVGGPPSRGPVPGILSLVFLAAAVLFGAWTPVRTASAETPGDAADPGADEFRTLVRTLQKERDKVRTGRVKLTGRKKVEIFENPKNSWEGPMEGLYTFNREANLFRYDGVSSGKFKLNLPGDGSLSTPEESEKTPVTPYRYGHCRSRDYFCSWGQYDSRSVRDIALLPLDRERTERGSDFRATFHVMAFGILNDMAFQKGVDLTEGQEQLLLWEIGRLEKQDRTLRLELRASDRETVQELTIDRDLMAPTQLKRGWPEIPNYCQIDVEWGVISGVAVPVRYTTSLTVPDETRETLEFKLDWLSINKEIPDDEFSFTSFLNLPNDRVEVQELRKKPVTILGRLRSDGTLIAPVPPPTR